MQRADMELSLGQTEVAEARFGEAAEAARAALMSWPGDPGIRRTLARSLARLGQSALLRGGLAEAGAPTEEAERIHTSLADPELPGVRKQWDQDNAKPLISQLELIEAQGQLAELMEERGLNADPLFRKAVDRMERLQQQFHDAPSLVVHYYHAWIESRLARSQIAQGRLAEARATLERLSMRLEWAMQPLERGPYVEVVMAESLMLTSKIDRLEGRTAPAIERARAALRFLDESEREGERTPDAMLLRAEALQELALSELDEPNSDRAQARASLEEASRLVEQVVAKGWNQGFLRALRDSIRERLDTTL
jgi:tetratricopeptide (TPR) repeat protein